MDNDIAEEARDLLSGFVYCWACIYLSPSINNMRCTIQEKEVKNLKTDGCIYGRSPIPVTKPL